MTRRLITIEVDGSIFAIRGWKAHGLALGAGLRPTFSGVQGAWVADTKRLPELVAFLQYRNIPVEILGVVEDPGRRDPEDADGDDRQLDLFGSDGAT